MTFSKELQEKINLLFSNNKELKDKLLRGDPDTIRDIGSISQKGIDPEDIVVAFESNDDEIMDYLYKKAKRTLELNKLYRELCVAYSLEKKKEITKDDEER